MKKKIITGRILGFIPFRGCVESNKPYPWYLRAALKLQLLLNPEATVSVRPASA